MPVPSPSTIFISFVLTVIKIILNVDVIAGPSSWGITASKTKRPGKHQGLPPSITTHHHWQELSTLRIQCSCGDSFFFPSHRTAHMPIIEPVQHKKQALNERRVSERKNIATSSPCSNLLTSSDMLKSAVSAGWRLPKSYPKVGKIFGASRLWHQSRKDYFSLQLSPALRENLHKAPCCKVK